MGAGGVPAGRGGRDQTAEAGPAVLTLSPAAAAGARLYPAGRGRLSWAPDRRCHPGAGEAALVAAFAACPSRPAAALGAHAACRLAPGDRKPALAPRPAGTD